MNANFYISVNPYAYTIIFYLVLIWGDHFPFLEGGIIFPFLGGGSFFYQIKKGDHFPFLEGGSFSEGDYFHGPHAKV